MDIMKERGKKLIRNECEIRVKHERYSLALFEENMHEASVLLWEKKRKKETFERLENVGLDETPFFKGR